MKKKTMGQVFAEIRSQKGMTMLEIAIKAEISEAVVWKLERDRPIRWESAHHILATLKVTPKSAAYQEMHALWLKGRQERAETQPQNLGKRLLSKHATEASRKFRILIHDLDPAQTKKVLLAAQKAASQLSQ